MSDRESLRPVIAEILDGLGLDEVDLERAWRMWVGARTLRWAHAYEETPTGDELLELEHLREIVGDIEGWLDETNRNGKPIHPGTIVKRVRARLDSES